MIPGKTYKSQDLLLIAWRRKWLIVVPFVLAVGSLDPRKNVPRLLRAIDQLRHEPPTRDVMLVHAGPPNTALQLFGGNSPASPRPSRK